MKVVGVCRRFSLRKGLTMVEKYDILIENETIKEISKDINKNVDNTIDCSGLYIMPGMIDIHCHLREPGFEYKETIETGSKSAVAGGFTTICPMPNTKPTPDSAIILSRIQEKLKKMHFVMRYHMTHINY